jgi:hypothetical protein
MTPVPLAELQRRLAEAGRIRMGEKTETAMKYLDTWRLTSPTKKLIEQAASLWGGEVRPWTAPTGEQWEVVTEATDLPVLVMPAYSLSRQYELWEGPSKCTRRCDGETEFKTDAPCICNAEGNDRCELHTRLTVVLPDLTTMLGWRLESTGINAAAELDTSLELIRGISRGAPFVPARLRIVERKGQKDGKATRYVVPVIDPAVSFAELAAESGRVALPTYTPAVPRAGLGVGDALDVTARQIEKAPPTARSAEPIGPTENVLDIEPIPVPNEDELLQGATETDARTTETLERESRIETGPSESGNPSIARGIAFQLLGVPELEEKLFDLTRRLGVEEATREAAEEHKKSKELDWYHDWLERCITAAEENLASKEPSPDADVQTQFPIPTKDD